MPLNAEGGFHSNLGFMVRNASFRSFEDYENYLQRLRSIPRYMSQQTDWLKAALEEGYTQPKAAMQGFEESIAAFIVQSPQDSLFYQPFQANKPVLSAQSNGRSYSSRPPMSSCRLPRDWPTLTRVG